MDTREIINSMSDDDALLALQAARAILAGDIEAAEVALKEMSTDGLDKFISVLEESVKQKPNCEVHLDAEKG